MLIPHCDDYRPPGDRPSWIERVVLWIIVLMAGAVLILFSGRIT
jgi:hypothetical protein